MHKTLINLSLICKQPELLKVVHLLAAYQITTAIKQLVSPDDVSATETKKLLFGLQTLLLTALD